MKRDWVDVFFWGIMGIVVLALLGILSLLGVYVYLNIQDSKSTPKPMTCTVIEKYVLSYKGNLSDRELRTKQCGKLSIGKNNVELWDSIQEGKTYRLMVKGGRTGNPDVVSAKEITA